MRLDELAPAYDFRERHLRPIAAPPARVFEAIEAVTPAEMPTFRALMNVRSLGRRRLGAGVDVPLFEQVVGQGFSLLARDPPAELVLGAVGQPWRLSGGANAELQSPEAFVAFAEPGFVKMAMNLAVSAAPGGSVLSTETRVLAIDVRSRRRFRLYWLVIRAGSGAIRRSWLRAIERRARSS